MTTECRVQPASTSDWSSLIQPSRLLASFGVVTPTQPSRCSTTPKTLGEPNSVRRSTSATRSPPPGSVRSSISAPDRTQTTG